MENPHPHPWRITGNPIRVLLILLLFAFLAPGSAMANAACKRATKDLQGSYQVIEGKGGIWGYLEKSPSLRDKSVMGLQADSKLQQLVERFNSMCANGKTPTKQLFVAIHELISRGRMLFNIPVDRQPPEKVLAKVTALNDDAGKLLESLTQ